MRVQGATHARHDHVACHPKRRDWVLVPWAYHAQLEPIPRTELWGSGERTRVAVHRSMLPLLPDPVRDAGLLQLAEASFIAPRFVDGTELRPHQEAGAAFLAARRGAFLMDQMRIGKTACAIASHDPASGPLVVVGPLAVRQVWLDWFARRWPDVPALALTGRGYDPESILGAPLVFLHYDILAAWAAFARLRPGTLVFDEAHVLTNPKALRTQAALALSPRAARVVALSGTPLWNKPIGLWPILACLNPGAWGTYYSFGERYSDGKKGAWGFRATGVSHVDEFRARMSEVALRRTWEDVAADLPPVTRSVEVADLSSDQAREVDFAAEAVRVAGATRTPVGELARYRQLVGHLKIPATVEAVKALVQEGETALVVWCWHRAVAGALVTAFSREFQGQLVSLAVTGDDPIEIRDTKLAFWRGEAGGILVITMAVGQTGIDLSRARHAVFAELDFTPSVVAQAEARTYAPSRPSAATYLVVDHRVERALADALVKKCDLGAVLGTPAAEAAVDILRQAFDVAEVGDLERLRAAVLEDLP